jgi:hypothetical protein
MGTFFLFFLSLFLDHSTILFMLTINSVPEKKDPHKVLGVKEEATLEEIKRAFYEVCIPPMLWYG